MESCGIVKVVQDSNTWPSTSDQFDTLHGHWCNAITEHLLQADVKNVTYGRAAKLVAVYLKTMIVIPDPESVFAAIAHPPVDRILLQNLARDKQYPSVFRKIWSTTNWTGLNEEAYYQLIDGFRQCGLNKPQFWRIERYWD